MVQCTHLITTGGTPHLYNRGSIACWLTLCILEKIICNSTNSVQISFIETLKLIVFSWTIWWCYWQNVLMINEKNNFLTVSWLSGLLSAEIFISTGEWGVQMPPLTSENSYFLRSGPQGATLVMWYCHYKYTNVYVLHIVYKWHNKWNQAEIVALFADYHYSYHLLDQKLHHSGFEIKGSGGANAS